MRTLCELFRLAKENIEGVLGFITFIAIMAFFAGLGLRISNTPSEYFDIRDMEGSYILKVDDVTGKGKQIIWFRDSLDRKYRCNTYYFGSSRGSLKTERFINNLRKTAKDKVINNDSSYIKIDFDNLRIISNE